MPDKIRGTHVKLNIFETLYFECQKKSVPSNFLISLFFNFFAFKTEKFHFSPEKRARTARLSVPIDSAVEKTFKYDVWICEKFFLPKSK